ncbi:MAG: hypothetical protein Ct9H300mP12_08900 [Acidimicrobiales bacterium]|nr:MAG: hypothetical protein Ct9H300mP12_08900 [Acidimicrobiales bacterium]
MGLNRDLGFSPDDRTENVRRIGEVCRCSRIRSGGAHRVHFALPPRPGGRGAHAPGGKPFTEVFVDTPLEVCEERESRACTPGLGRENSDFSGISAPYETPTRLTSDRHWSTSPRLRERRTDVFFPRWDPLLMSLTLWAALAQGLADLGRGLN